MIRAVIFDLDGTLLDTLDDLTAAVNHALQSCGFPQRTRDEVRAFIGNGVIRLMQRAVPQGTAQPEFDRCFALFREHYLSHMNDRTRAFDGILPLLGELKRRGVKSAVVSNKLHAGVAGLCNTYFTDSVDCALGVADESERKPNPVNVLRAMQTLGVSPEETLCVGDSEVDVQTAENAGLRCVGATWGYRSRETLLQAGAWRLIDIPQALLPLLD
ncbi:MAG: HAD family hydrolase [Clostridia bacterium]|nr:HAD family hydrolase [Clostridia bacterium]